MSVILQLSAVTWAQGYTAITTMNMTNSGNENAQNVNLKVTDSAIFTDLRVLCAGGYSICLNIFSTGNLRFYVGSVYTAQLPASSTKTFKLSPNVKAAAPIQVHNLSCDFTYAVY